MLRAGRLAAVIVSAILGGLVGWGVAQLEHLWEDSWVRIP